MKSKSKIYFLAISLIFFSFILLNSQETKTKQGVNWPGFRGNNADGIAEGFSTPVSWDAESAKNIKWKTPIPGLAHSSPVVWEDRIFVTTAVSSKKNPELKVGLYGSGDPVEDNTVHEWKIFCLDKNTGKILWEKLSHKGVPKQKRHPKATQVNSTPATNGKYVVAFFSSEGLYCYDVNGKLIWKNDLGIMNSGPFNARNLEWGFASSPVIYKDRVIMQCDVLNQSFLALFDLKTGKEIWRTDRDEDASWGTPTIYTSKGNTQIIVNGYKHIGGYDFKTGKESWKMRGGGDIPVPTPVIAHDLIFINSAHGKLSPIYVIKPNSEGEISLKDKETSNASIVWSVRRGGAYMQTPLIYGDYLYNLRGNGSLTCYKAKTGELIYREKLGKSAAFSASGVAADGKLYFPGEEGDIYVIKAGPEFELLSTNLMKDICMATPAISEGALYFRTHHYLMAVATR